jgi:septal ring factor EnvC (AmiA/AmiB activator)
MLRFPVIASALAIIALIVVVLALSLLQSQKHLRLVHGELDGANKQIVQSTAATAELEKTVAKLKTELDEASKARRELQENLDEATSDNEQLTLRLPKRS